MLICADLSTNKTDILTDEYAALVNSGISSNKILVLVQNSKRKQYFTDKVFEKLSVNCIEKLQIHSFNSLVYNTINDNWAVLENLNPYDNPTILPNLTGLEVSQFLLKDILQDIQFKGYNSKKSLLHQLFRRYSLIVQNNLSDDDVNWRSDILKESFAQDAKQALKKLLEKTLALRGFDYLRQNLLFNYIYKNTDYFKDIEYLILDDGDEITPICFDFIEFLNPQLKDVFIAYDEHGASRAGYLSADRTAVWKFEELFDQKPQALKSDNKMNSDAQILFENILSDKLSILNNFSINSLSKRAVMVDECITKVKKLLSNNVKPSEISIITPIIDDMLKFTLKENISTNIVFLSGSEKLIQNKLVKSVLTILKLSMKIPVSEFDLRVVLSRFLNIRIKYCKDILENFKISGKLIDYEFEFDDYNKKYKNFKSILNDLSQYDIKLSDKVYIIYDKLAQFYTVNTQEISKFNFFVKQLQEFENVFKSDFSSMQEKIITDIENSIISENPYSVEEISLNDLIVSTPQKIIDNQVRTKYQFWLDTSSSEWIKADTGPLYNAWVFQRGWKKSEFTIDDNIELSKEKTARILRKLTLCAKEHIYTYSSLFDGNGIENFGGIQDYIKIAETEKIENVDEKQFKITPRDDQKPVLEYKSGRMAISAVPGAGKTTILLLLILKLLEEGVEPENIFVMTYMESAARNFRDKIKSINKNSTHLPNISTIHGLALRILKDNGNFERLGLNPDFEICDDSQKSRITDLIVQKLNLKKNEIHDFER
ncbi:ATP-dependent helicase, partial [bacterium]|nr:ATP-dependent helicase [bacterium]